jgi:HTH-type transcriptional regulator / antitoxin HigA
MALATTDLRYDPDHAVPPGHTLRDTLEKLGMTQTDLAARTGFSVKHINQIIKGGAPITSETALDLEKITGVPARVWNNLESAYRDRLARLEDRQALANDVEWLKTLPVKELIKRGKLPNTKDTGALLQEACRFFAVANREGWERVWRRPLAAFRRSPSFESDIGAVASWLRLGELEAAEVECEAYDAKRFKAAIAEIRGLTIRDPEDWQPRVVKLCAQAGVAVVFVPEIKGTRASGAAHWLTPTKAVIQLSLRHKSDDHLWFSFFHEAGHILLHSKKQTFVSGEITDESADLEEEANAFAAQTLIPRRYDSRLVTLTTAADIIEFADEVGIAPGIVVGRLQKAGHLDWSQCNHLKKRLRFA